MAHLSLSVVILHVDVRRAYAQRTTSSQQQVTTMQLAVLMCVFDRWQYWVWFSFLVGGGSRGSGAAKRKLHL